MKRDKKKILVILLLTVFVAGLLAGRFLLQTKEVIADNLRFDEQELTIRAINKVLPATVSIIVYTEKDVLNVDLKTGEQIISKEKKALGSGTGFIITSDGLILTNKHVIDPINKDSEYKIVLNSGKQYYARFVDKDPLNDLAILKIYDKNLPVVELGNSNDLVVGTTVIAIGNVLGRYKNSATKGIISGLERFLTPSDLTSGKQENLDNVIQTDADINLGNSGGPLVNLKGQVVGINVAIDESGTGVGFAIPINDAKPVVKSIKEVGHIVRPKLGLHYVMLNPVIAEQNNLKMNKGAWVYSSVENDPAVEPLGPAEKAGIKNGDIILEVNGTKIEGKTTLVSVLQAFKPGNKIKLKIWREGKESLLMATLEEFK